MDVTPTIEVPTGSFADHKKRNSKHHAAYSPDNKIKQKENLKLQMEGAKRFQVTRMLEPEKRTVEIKPILPTFKIPITVPRPGDYLLSRTQSTTGIATKRALELKKKYLLGPQVNTALQKSDSASELNSKFREFHSNISECQKLLNPATEISPSMQAFLDNSLRRNASGLLSPSNPVVPAISNLVQNSDSKHNNNLESVPNPSQSMPDIVQTSLNSNSIVGMDQSVRNNSANEKRPTSPVFKILVPKIPWKNKNEEPSGTDVDSDSLSLGSSSEDESENHNTRNSISVPRVEIMKPCGEVMQLDSLMIVDGQYIGPQDSDEDYPLTAVPKELPDPIPTTPKQQTEAKPVQEISSSDSGNDITAFFTDNEPLDWAVEGSTDTLRLKKSKRNPHYTLDDHFNEHICGKTVQVKHKASSVLDRDHSDIDFMDTGSEESVIENEDSLTTNAAGVLNTGFVEFVDVDVDQYNTTTTRVKYPEAVNKHCAPLLNYDRSLDYIEQGAGILVSNNESNLPQPVNKLNETVLLEVAPIQNEVKEDEPAEQIPVILTLPSEPESVIDEEFVQLKSMSDISECKDSARKLSNSPATSRKLEEITKEKDWQKDLVHQLVMDNISKRTDRRDRRSRSTNLKPPVPVTKPEDVITSVGDPILTPVASEEKRSTNLKNSLSLKLKPLALDGTQCFNGKYLNNETFSLPDIHQSVLEEHSKRPSRNVFTVRQRMLSEPDALELSNCNPPTGIVPGFRQLSLSDYSGKLVQHVESLRNSKESCQQASSFNNFCTSDPNFFTIDNCKKHKGRDDRRKSIIKTVSDFFSRRRDPTGTNNISPTHDKKPKFQPVHKLRIKSSVSASYILYFKCSQRNH